MSKFNLLTKSLLPHKKAKLVTVILLCLANLVNYMERLTVSGDFFRVILN